MLSIKLIMKKIDKTKRKILLNNFFPVFCLREKEEKERKAQKSFCE